MNPKMLLMTGVTGVLIACGIGLSSANAVTLTAGTTGTHVRKIDVNDLKAKDSLVAITPRDRDLIAKFLNSALRIPITTQYVKIGNFDTALRDLRGFFASPAQRPIQERVPGKIFIVQLDEQITIVARNTSSLPGENATIEIQDKTSGTNVVIAKVRYGKIETPLASSLGSSGSSLGDAKTQASDQKSKQEELNQVQMQQVQQVQMQIENKQYDEARATANSFIESSPQLATGYFLRGFAYMGLEDVNSAIVDLEKSASISEREGMPEKAAEARRLVEEMRGAQL
jgi:tetratricopeptide (TPR) repeat protein